MIKLRKKLYVAALPTPVYKLEKLSAETGVNIWIKRDDITGAELSGNKIRKLEYIFRELLDGGFNVVITTGGVQSNHCRATAALAARVGIKCHLVLNGDSRVENTGNLFLDRLFGAEVTFVSKGTECDDMMKQVSDELTIAGYKTYTIPVGASNALGAFGYIEAYNEIASFEKENNIRFDDIIIPCGSGGTYAGLMLGSRLNGDTRNVTGICVCDDEKYFKEEISKICQQFAVEFSEDVNIPMKDIRIIDGYVGRGYALSRPEEIKFIKKTAETEGVVVDPVYTGKALYGLVSEIKNGGFKGCKNILFIHTGGIFGIFSDMERFV